MTRTLTGVGIAWPFRTWETTSHLVAHAFRQSAATLLLIFFAVRKTGLHIFICFVRNRALRFRTRSASFFSRIDVSIQAHFAFLKLQRHRFSAAPFLVNLPFSSLIGPLTPDIRAQKLFLRPARLPFGFFSVTGAFSFEPVARLYFARPLAVNPAPRLAGNFSPRPTDKLTDITAPSSSSIIETNRQLIYKQPESSFSQKIYMNGHNTGARQRREWPGGRVGW